LFRNSEQCPDYTRRGKITPLHHIKQYISILKILAISVWYHNPEG
jgi:hypothetical protein